VVVTTSLQKDVGIKSIQSAIEIIKEEITKRKGQLTVKVAPRTVHERDERELNSLMKKLELQNRDRTEEEEEAAANAEDGSEEEDEEEEQ